MRLKSTAVQRHDIVSAPHSGGAGPSHSLWPMRHQVVDARGTRIHCVEEGAGPLVLLVHGFPESWYSWRHQLPVIAEAGFRAVAIDVRGYGRSSAPLAVEAYGMLQHVSDNLGVVEALAGRARRRSSSATTGGRRSPPTRHCCGRTSSPR